MRLFLPLLLLVPLLSACNNDCARYCKELADYWSECGIEVGDSEVADCRKTWARGADPLPGGTQNAFEAYGPVCRTMLALEENADGQREIALRARFSCDDMRNGPGGAFGG